MGEAAQDIVLYAERVVGLPAFRAACEAVPSILPYLFPALSLFSVPLKFGTDWIFAAGDRQALERTHNVVQQLIVDLAIDRERYAEFHADVHIALRDLLQRTTTEPHEDRLRILVELLAGLMDHADLEELEAHHRFKRWVLALEIKSLAALRAYNPNTADDRFHGQQFMHQHYEPMVPRAFQYFAKLARDVGIADHAFVADLESAGIARFDRGGGTLTQNENAHVVVHWALNAFVEKLQSASRRPSLDV